MLIFFRFKLGYPTPAPLATPFSRSAEPSIIFCLTLICEVETTVAFRLPGYDLSCFESVESKP